MEKSAFLHKKNASRTPSAQNAFLFIQLSFVQRFPIALNDLFIPPERFLAVAFQCTRAVVIPVHIDIAVAFPHLRGGSADQIDTAPGGIAHHLHAVMDRFPDLQQMLPQIVDTVIVQHRFFAVICLDQLIRRSQPVFLPPLSRPDQTPV